MNSLNSLSSLNSCKSFQASNLLGPKALVDGFEHKGHIVKSRVASDVLEALPADLSVAEPFVSVDVATQRAHSLVEVHTTQIVE